MKIYAAVYVYKRSAMLKRCVADIINNTLQPDELHLIDDGPGDAEVAAYLREVGVHPHVTVISKGRNRGATHSGRMMLAYAREFNPEYLFFIEADHLFRRQAFENIVEVFEGSEVGQQCLGITGYDHPNYYLPITRSRIFPEAMRAQVGEDNVNRAVLHVLQPHRLKSGFDIGMELASNTCPTSYIAWRRLQKMGQEFPQELALFYQAFNPQENPNYPDSGVYAAGNIVDDGMLSHSISLMWNRHAIKHGIDRHRFGAWVNIKPSVAQNITGGGNHTGLKEGETDGGSPTWKA